ncbi:unconventional myosin-XVIIIa-like [Homarus americanus]|uniref:unconventional myosin-XVIIIa-like n=1 Tax=Homarus americanus TaxID=6706 RepID=UPI001C44FF82|nr:unconventional myosin-XVIIIa-like [Homarus americanus]
MLRFMKKDKDKEDDKKKKKDKKERKESKRSKDRATLTLDELKRLDEARRSLIGKGRKKKDDKLPSGITADYMEQFRSGLGNDQSEVDLSSAGTFQELRERYEAMASASSLQSDSSSDGISLRSGIGMPPRPPKRGILKGKGDFDSAEYQGVKGDIDDESNLLENTMQNELIMYENLRQDRALLVQRLSITSLTSPRRVSNGSALLSPRSPPQQLMSPLRQPHPKLVVEHSPVDGFDRATSPPATPTSPIPVGESVGHHNTKTFAADLRLPALVPAQPPAPRTLTIDRSPAGDFGFSLRRAQVVERSPDNTETRRTIVFAEPGAVGRANVTGLLPGDRLLQVNGISVENKIRDEIIELIKASPNCVTLVWGNVKLKVSYSIKVQDIAQLKERITAVMASVTLAMLDCVEENEEPL